MSSAAGTTPSALITTAELERLGLYDTVITFKAGLDSQRTHLAEVAARTPSSGLRGGAHRPDGAAVLSTGRSMQVVTAG